MAPKKFDQTIYGEYFRLTDKYLEEYGERTIVLYQNGAFLEMYDYYNPEDGTFFGSKMRDIMEATELKASPKYTTANQQIIYMSGFSLDNSGEKYIRKIQEAGFTSIVYLQKEQRSGSERYVHSIISPGTYLANGDDSHSVGNNTALSNNVACIWVHKQQSGVFSKTPTIHVGMSNINIITGETFISQYKMGVVGSTVDQTSYDGLSNFFSIMRPSEVIFIYDVSGADLDAIIEYIDVGANTLVHKVGLLHVTNTTAKKEKEENNATRAHNCEKQIYQQAVLHRFYDEETIKAVDAEFCQNELATQAFVYLLEFVYRHNPHLVKKICLPLFENYGNNLVLANHSLRQLNIIDDGMGGNNSYKGRLSCVLNMLNLCKTPMGRRQFAYNLLHPQYPSDTLGYKRLQDEYDITEHAIATGMQQGGGLVYQQLAQLSDMAKIHRQIIARGAAPSDLVTLYKNVSNVCVLIDYLHKDAKITAYLEDAARMGMSLDDVMTKCEKVVTYLREHINMHVAVDVNTRAALGRAINGFEINFMMPGHYPMLDAAAVVHEKADDALRACCSYLSQFITTDKRSGAGNSSEKDDIKISETDKEGIITLTTTQRKCKLLEDALPTTATTVTLGEDGGLELLIGKRIFQYTKHGSSAKGTIYKVHNEQLSEMCDAIRQNKAGMTVALGDAFMAFMDEFARGDVAKALEVVIKVVGLIDMIYCRATIATKYGYCKPELVCSNAEGEGGSGSFIDAVGLRHALIEQLHQNVEYVANDMFVGSGASAAGVLLYGTNMVGKTSFIKSMGIALIMAQAGLYVPATRWRYAPYQQIFTRIIGNDNLFKGLSTFATEMIELRTIFRQNNRNSLILADEVCSGTEMASAVGIFMAGLRRLYASGCTFMFATHMHEIVGFPEFALEMPRIRFCHMKVRHNRELDQLVYDRKICDGSGETMYGLEVCSYLKFPADFMAEAYQYRQRFVAATDILLLKTSRYNAQKLKGTACEMCGGMASTEVHHVVEQHTANVAGLVVTGDGVPIHKNRVSNLMALCETCHLAQHHDGAASVMSMSTSTRKKMK